MPAKGTCRTYRKAVRSREKKLRAAEEEPMRVWPHPIPQADTEPEDDPVAETETVIPAAVELGETGGAILEQLELQSQLLVDLLGAVNALTAALLAQHRKE